ncbi:hypothetical protein LUZ60_016804 [Juncus effusus]|nr:hypothetical protein LUZ60_016804 [Juncus effusus]
MSSELKRFEAETTSTRLIESVTGSHRFKIASYSLQKEIGVGNFMTSAIFTVGEYDWIIRYYPDGSNESNKDYLAFFLELKTDQVDEVKVRFIFTMLDQSEIPPPLNQTSSMYTFGSKNKCLGYKKFIERKTFEKSKYLHNDSFTIMCTVTIINVSHLQSKKIEPVKVPPPNLGQQLIELFETTKGADVIFEVGGRYFRAHKYLLAARSPVFSAQFFGPMNENGAKRIKVDDIEPEVFRLLMYFIYSDSVPEIEEGDPIIYQHLLVAADRYEVERLKLICENKLAKNIAIKNIATTLTLAEQHNCSELKASCIRFVSSYEILSKVMDTDGFEHLIQSCPFILKELVKNVSSKA